MTTRLAYILYVVAVLLISGLARAHADLLPLLHSKTVQVPAFVDRVDSVGKDKFTLEIEGYLPNENYTDPVVSLKASATEQNVLILRLRTVAPPSGLIHFHSLVEFYYHKTVNVPELVKASQLKIDPKQNYLIKAESNSFKMQARGIDLISP